MIENKVSNKSQSDDYRQSHQRSGGTYDATIAASPFDAYMAHFEREYLTDIVPSLFPRAKPRYLDFACGTGRITETVAPLTAEAIGVDISASMLAEARSKCLTVVFHEADLTQSDVGLGLFDLVTTFRFVGNAQQDLRISVLKVLNRHLRPGGYLILNNHRNPLSIAVLLGWISGGDLHGMDLNYFKLKRLLRDCGFEIVDGRSIGAWMFRHKLLEIAEPTSSFSRQRESIFRHRLFIPIAPDAILVAKKIS